MFAFINKIQATKRGIPGVNILGNYNDDDENDDEDDCDELTG